MSRHWVAAAIALFAVGTVAAAFAQAEVVQKGSVRVSASAELAPQRLPRHGRLPISVSFAGRISTTNATEPPRLESLQIAINRNGILNTHGLPDCPAEKISTASSTRALGACRKALVGQGRFLVDVHLAGQEPYPTVGRLLVFNGRRGGRPALLGHIYSARPFATSFVIPFLIRTIGRGTYGTELSAQFPPSFGHWGSVTGLEMKLSRRYSYRGSRRSFASAGCPLPDGLPSASFRLARTRFGFAGGTSVSVNQVATCKARGR
jgi:hypothetical protein